MHCSETNRYYWLDWIRFLAAFQVLLCHVRGAHFLEYGALSSDDKGWMTALAFALSRLGHEAVVVFFVLSGYLVGGRSLQRAVEGRFNVSAYWLDRVTRIYVPLVPALGLTALATLLQRREVSGMELAGNLFGLQGVFSTIGVFGGNAPLWSLAFEMWFYVLWGCALATTTAGSFHARVAFLMLTATSLAVLCQMGAVHYLGCWLSGAVAHQLGAVTRRVCLLLVGLLLAGIGMVLTQLNSGTVSVNITIWQRWIPNMATSVLILASGFVLMVHVLSAWQPGSESVSRLERHGKFWADFSYTLYLTHYVMLGLWVFYFPGRRQVDLASCVSLILKLIAVLAASWGIYYCFERHTGHVRRWLRDRFGPS